MLFLMIVSLYTSRVVLSVLGIEDFGIYDIVGGFVSMFAILSSALTSACARFLNYEMGKGNRVRLKVVFSSTVTIQYFLAVIIAILCETIGLWFLNVKMVIPSDRIIAANWCFQFSIFNFCMNLVTIPYRAAIVAHEQMKAFAYISIFEGLAKLMICYLILFSPFDRLIFYGLLLLLLQFIVRMTFQVFCYRHYQECHYQFVIDIPILKSLLSYSGWHFIGNSSGILKNHGVNIVLNLFFGPSINAAKGIANQVQHAVQGFAGNFMMALNPQITQSYAKGDLKFMFNLINKGSRYSFFMLFILSLPLIINADYILHLWLKNVPAYAVILSQLSLIEILISSLSNPLITAQNATGNVRNYQIIIGGIMLLNLPLSYVSLWLGANPLSVMWVAIVIEIICLIVRIYIIPIHIREFQPFLYVKEVIANCFFVALFSSIMPIFLTFLLPQTFLSVSINIFITVLLSIISVLFVGCTKDERCKLYNNVKPVVYKWF